MWMKSEEDLIEEALQGSPDAFEALLRPYRQGILNMAYRMTGNLEEAKEICQEAIIKIFRYLSAFKKGKSFKSWLYKTVVNLTFDFLRKKKRHEQMIESQKELIVHDAFNPEKRFLNQEIKEKIQSCLHILSPKERAVFLLRDGEGLSIKEASMVLGSSSISIRTHLSRARQKIRAQFEKIYPVRNWEEKR